VPVGASQQVPKRITSVERGAAWRTSLAAPTLMVRCSACGDPDEDLVHREIGSRHSVVIFLLEVRKGVVRGLL